MVSIAPGIGTVRPPFRRFVSEVRAAVGAATPMLFVVPRSTDTTAASGLDQFASVVTWDATVAARLSKQGYGYVQSFSGTGQYGSVPDAGRFSFVRSASGSANAAVTTTDTTLTDTRLALVADYLVNAIVTCNGKTMTITSNTATTLTGASWSGGGNPGNGNAWTAEGDSPLSIIALANVTNTAGPRSLLIKGNYNAIAEWAFLIESADTLTFYLTDRSVGTAPSRASNSAITQGSLRLFGMSYSGIGGATCANGITLYQDGAAIASTAVNNAAYVSMENLAVDVGVGASRLATPINLLTGSLGFVLLVAANLSAAQHARVKSAVNRYYRLAL